MTNLVLQGSCICKEEAKIPFSPEGSVNTSYFYLNEVFSFRNWGHWGRLLNASDLLSASDKRLAAVSCAETSGALGGVSGGEGDLRL